MLNNVYDTAATNNAPATNHEDSSSTFKLSANTRARLEKLAPWRIDPALLKFPKHGPNFEGGYATVSKALWTSSFDGDQVMESSQRDLKSSDCLVKVEGNNEGQKVGESNNDANENGKEEFREEEHQSNDGTPGQVKAVAVKKMKMKKPGEVVRVLGLALREAEFLVKLSHENIIELKGFVEDASREVIWLIFPWENNGTLKDFVASHDWEIPERLALIFDVTRGVEYLHSRESPICHGDLKSINILVSSECRAIITDFGSAHHPVVGGPNKEKERTLKEPQVAPSIEATLCPSTNTITLTCHHYTLRWAAPELLEEDEATLATDIWALGCVAYEVMTNSIPFQDVKDAMVIKRVVRGDLPPISSDARMLLIRALCTLMEQCWSTDSSKRPTAEDCRKALHWMPMITPSPGHKGEASSLRDRSAELLIQLGSMHWNQSDYPNAGKYHAQALSVYSGRNHKEGKAKALVELARVHRCQQEYSRAITSYTEALEIHTERGDKPGRASALWGLASVHRLRTDYRQAVKLYSECLQIWTEICDRQGRADALWGLADIHRLRNEYSEAVAFYSECLQIRTDISDRQGRASVLRSLAEVHRLQKEYSQAMTLLSEALKIAIELGDKYGRAFTLQHMANVHRDQYDHKSAIQHHEQAAEIFKQIGHSNEVLVLEQVADQRLLIEQGAS